MNRWMKLAVVLAGYALALLASFVAVAIEDLNFSPADNQEMGGMIAGGEMIYGTGVFVLVALVPTGLASGSCAAIARRGRCSPSPVSPSPWPGSSRFSP